MAKISQARGEFDKALSHSERALELNPNDGDLLANYGQMLTYAGQSKEARHWVEDAMRRNPHYPGWYASALSSILYLEKDYEGAFASLNKVGTLAIWDHRQLAASYAQLGRQAEAQRHVDAVLKTDPNFSLSTFVATLKFRSDADKEHVLDGLRKAGLPD
jgi:adenylate cyclase